ncbi:putative mitochondrial hypothetical protein [Leptomonas pyrrhocoris]|uniref:Mitochondrial import inner membrane translocase subunit n=1 Tax=Leptomonas pyrrhocoris TaxID=157538 RepID=A0A0N0DRW5_LEPPY|nr:putative mitochondrial hypothetical protein [Leptomonas pyrrhocoris]XP_015653194.1 putative mitochondrial hypothetical protein [Leptomonas pyrrhocoris]KPA74754.1 putative mitochondrial hypothetical protein [Leptomonas pyrrhocoris]KPA74755.1 putative mitochondrial hypothetical protein [Leptomonas pyrrhocoris]|eukprot:XP_015653193.1 putative mitochondrial hypothetical protein [Leptomonas pyrrhocoris]
MQAQMALQQSMEQYIMLDFANIVLEQCWDTCYDRNLTRAELASGDIPDVKFQKMDACARKCVGRHFEVMKLMMESREIRAKEEAQGLAPGTLSQPS